MATLDLTNSPSTLVWRLIVAQLQGDTDLDRVINTWITWDGASNCNTDLASDAVVGPALRIYPTEGPMVWEDASRKGWFLNIAVECTIPGMDVEDILNLQGAIMRALYPDDRAAETAFEQALVLAGAVTGLIEFSQPIVEPLGAAGVGGDFHPLGQFRIRVARTVAH